MDTTTDPCTIQYTPGAHKHTRKPDSQIPAKRVAFVSLRMVRERSVLYPRRQIHSAADAVQLVKDMMEDADRELFVVIALDTKHRPTLVEITSTGSLDATICHPREVYKSCLLSNSSGVIVLHNHPSGDPTPSKEDIAVTKRLAQCGDILGVDLVDHIVIGQDGRFESLRAASVIQP